MVVVASLMEVVGQWEVVASLLLAVVAVARQCWWWSWLHCGHG